jgi:lysophospholipase
MKSITSHFLGTKGLQEKEIRDYYSALKEYRKALKPNVPDRQANEVLFEKEGGLRFFYQTWSSSMKNFDKVPKAIVVALHGVYSHSDVFYPLADYLNPLGVLVVALDYRGHGRTGGQAGGNLGDIDSFEKIVEDLHELVLNIQKNYEVPLFFLGVDVGALLALHISSFYQDIKIAGFIFCAPLWKFKETIKNLLKRPLLMVGQIYKKGEGIISVPPEPLEKTLFQEYIPFAKLDPLRLQKTSIRFEKSLLEIVQGSNRYLKSTDRPVLMFQGTKDYLVDHFAIHKLYEKWGHGEKKIRFYENAGHNLFADKYTQEVYEEIKQFLKLDSK